MSKYSSRRTNPMRRFETAQRLWSLRIREDVRMQSPFQQTPRENLRTGKWSAIHGFNEIRLVSTWRMVRTGPGPGGKATEYSRTGEEPATALERSGSFQLLLLFKSGSSLSLPLGLWGFERAYLVREVSILHSQG